MLMGFPGLVNLPGPLAYTLFCFEGNAVPVKQVNCRCVLLGNMNRSLAGVARLLISSTQLSASQHSQQKQLISGTNRELSHSTDVSS